MNTETSFSLICPDKTVVFFLGLAVGLCSFFAHRAIDLLKVNREDFNKVIDKAEMQVAELIKLSCAYWAKPYDVSDTLQEQEIKNSVIRIGKYISDLHKMRPSFDKSAANTKLKNFSQLMTSGDFETSSRAPDQSRCGHIRDMGMRFEAYFTSNKIKKSFFN